MAPLPPGLRDERGIDGSRQADYDYGLEPGFGPRGQFDLTRAYLEAKAWTYADYFATHYATLSPGRKTLKHGAHHLANRQNRLH